MSLPGSPGPHASGAAGQPAARRGGQGHWPGPFLGREDVALVLILRSGGLSVDQLAEVLIDVAGNFEASRLGGWLVRKIYERQIQHLTVHSLWSRPWLG